MSMLQSTTSAGQVKCLIIVGYIGFFWQQAPELPEANIDRMVNELVDRGHKRKEFSRRRKFHEERDVDSINDRNEHFNRKIERAFGKYTVEIKNNLERGTALPD